MHNNNQSIEQSPILITGCARSGTSMVAGVIHKCGGFGGDLIGPSPYNAKGMFENRFIRDKIDKGYLRAIGVDPKGQNPFPDTSNMPIPSNWKAQVDAVMLREGYKEGPWFYKGARCCLVWPVWNYAYPNAKWVIVRRKTADIIDSCLNTSFMNAYTTREGWLEWVHHHEECFVEMIKAGCNVKQVWPERMLRGDYEQMLELIEWLGLTWRAEEVLNFIEPKLWKGRKKRGLKMVK